MLPEMARVLDATVSHRAGRLTCVKAGELPGLSERHSIDCGTRTRIVARRGCRPLARTSEFVSGSRRGGGVVGGGVSDAVFRF
jgi:hypothetical protein